MVMPSDRPTSIVRGMFRAFRIAATRLRFLYVFAVVFVVIGSWETIRTYWGRLTTAATSEPAISIDTEYFCPMDPGILSDWPSKCPVCNMTLVRRKRGEAVPLPEGVDGADAIHALSPLAGRDQDRSGRLCAPGQDA